MLSQWLTAKVLYSFRGRSWPLVFTHRALLLCQDATGIDTLAADLSDPPASFLRGLLYGLLVAAGAKCSLEDAGREFKPSAVIPIRKKIIDAWIAAMADPEREPYRPERESSRPPEKRTWYRKWAYETSRDGLGIAEDKWLDMTPRQVQELDILHLRQLQREEYLTGILAAETRNFSACHPKEITRPEAFMIHEYGPDMEDDESMHVGDKMAAYYSKFPSQGDAGPAPPPEARVPVITGPIPKEHLQYLPS